MVNELWFYFTTVLICAGIPLLMQSYPRWKLYFGVGFLLVVIGGAVLVYVDAKDKEEGRIKMGQMQHMLDEAKQETKKQEAVARDAAKQADLLGEQLRAKTLEIRKVLKEHPKVDGAISKVRLFPWQRESDPRQPTDNLAATMGILVYAHVENHGFSTTLSNWELRIELPDHTVVKPQRWPVRKNLRVACEDGSLAITKHEYLDVTSTHLLQQNQERSGVTVWMAKNVPLDTIRTEGSVYTLSVRDSTGVVHAVESFTLDALPQRCFGFEVLN